VDERGQPTSLSAYRGRVVVLASFLTLCQETCPLTTGAFLSMHRAVAAAGLGNRVVFIEATVDPDRDRPARLAAYAQLSGAGWPLLTGTPANLASLWKFFGAYYEKTPEATPPGIDWWTHQPLTYDVSHSDGFFLIDARGHERFATIATPDVGGQLKPALSNLLGEQGHQDLSHPGTPSWTPSEGLQAIGWLVGRHIVPASS
jgi:protein SCO1/2